MEFLHFLVSFLASIIGAISGIGGGVVIKPALDAFQMEAPITISFLSSSTVLAMTTVALIRSRKSTIKVDKKRGTLMAGGAIAGGFAGKMILESVQAEMPEEAMLGASQSIVLMFLTLGVLGVTVFKSRITPLDTKHWLIPVAAGLALGAFSTFLGIGGGPFNLTVLYLLFAMDSKTAALNSIYIIFFSQLTNLIITLATGGVPDFTPLVLILMIIGGIGGGLIGTVLSKKMTNRHVDILFSLVTLLIILVSGMNFLRYSGWV